MTHCHLVGVALVLFVEIAVQSPPSLVFLELLWLLVGGRRLAIFFLGFRLAADPVTNTLLIHYLVKAVALYSMGLTVIIVLQFCRIVSLVLWLSLLGLVLSVSD